MPQYRPMPTGNLVIDEALRIIFDNLYTLREQGLKTNGSPKLPNDLEAKVNRALALALNPGGPGAGTYTVGAKLTPAGQNGTITLDAQGRVKAIQQAT